MKTRKILSATVAVAMLLSMVQLGALAAQTDPLAGQWYEGAMTAAVERGIIGGDENGDLQPTRAITRGEMAVMLDRVMDYQAKADNKFGDLAAGAYYTDAILGASAAGILKGDDNGNVNPGAGITRQETAVMLARVMGIADAAAPSGQFADQASIASWAVNAVNAMKAAGYMGAQEVNFRPLDAITRAEVATVLGNLFAGYFNKAETYSADVKGSAVVNAAGATLKNMKISGDLIIAEGVGDGNVYLDGVDIGGRLLVRGGGVNSIYIRGASQVGNVIIARVDGAVRVVVEGSAQVEVVVVDDGSDDVKIDGTVGTVQVDSADITVEVTGKVGTVTVNAANASLMVSGTVNKVETTAAATGAEIATTATAKITAVAASGAGTQITGSGKVETVSAQANDVKVATPNTKVEAAAGTTGVTAGGKPVAGGSTATNPGTSTGGGSAPSTAHIANVSDLAGLEAALGNAGKTIINITGDISAIPATLKVERTVTINGGGHTLTFATLAEEAAGERNGLLVMANDVKLNNIKITMVDGANIEEDARKWDGVYGIQVYNVDNVTINNYTGRGGDAALLVNSAEVTLTGTTTVSGNQFGGIEVSKGTAEGLQNSTLTIDGTIVNTTEELDNPTVWVINGQGAVDSGGTLPSSKAVGDKTYYYITAIATTVEELRAALVNTQIENIKLASNLGGIAETIEVNRPVTINGNGKTLSFESLSTKPNGERNGLLVMADNVTIKDITVAMANVEGWKGIYGIQVYNVNDVTLHNYTGSGGDAALLVNGAEVTLEGETDVSGNEFGGIEVSMGEGLVDKAVLTVNGTIVNTTEADDKPTVWVDGVNDGTVEGTYGLRYNEKVVEGKDQKHYYLPEVSTAGQFKVALTKEYMKHIEITANMDNISETFKINHGVEINGNNHTLTFISLAGKAAGQKNGLLVMAAGVTIKDIKIEMANANDLWQGVYGIQVYDVAGVTIEDYTGTGGDAALLVNGSTVTLTGTTDVSGNEFGGIEVSKGKDLVNGAELTINGTIVNTTEAEDKPTVWVINGQGTVTGMIHISPQETKIYYYINSGNVPDIEEIPEG